MNEENFNLIARKDLDNLNNLISKNWFETSDFKSAVLNASLTLGMLWEALNSQKQVS